MNSQAKAQDKKTKESRDVSGEFKVKNEPNNMRHPGPLIGHSEHRMTTNESDKPYKTINSDKDFVAYYQEGNDQVRLSQRMHIQELDSNVEQSSGQQSK